MFICEETLSLAIQSSSFKRFSPDSLFLQDSSVAISDSSFEGASLPQSGGVIKS